MPRSQPHTLERAVISYSAERMPNDTIAELQHSTLAEYRAGAMTVADALRITNLLLNIAIQKLQTLT
jgi:hypothetical protein